MAVLTLLALIFPLAVAGSALVWWGIALRIRRGEPIVAYDPRQPVPWGLIELLLIAAAYMVIPSTVGRWLLDAGDAEASAPLRAMVLAGPLVALGAMLILVVRGASWHDLGLKGRDLSRDAWLGVLGFVAIAPPVYALQALLSQWFPGQHPLVELLQAHRDWRTMAEAGIAAVIVAPLVEELLFRVVLQGWLERLSAIVTSHTEPIPPAPTSAEKRIVPAALDENPYAAPLTMHQAGDVAPWTTATAVAWLPIVTSSLIFAALHHRADSADPIPLFFLALVLGYLYQRTHRIWPGVVLHATLNGVSLFMLLAAIGSR